ncbi:MAG TPA: DUF6800 family protein [Terriglobales bacterium]|jgi:hypothetical protein|nr:DUF6800 family protein [Terriglobales bacterium]
MTTPSRKSEIRRRRARTEKIALLRKRYAAAKSEGDRAHIVEKLRRLSPTFSMEEFLKPIQAAKGS